MDKLKIPKHIAFIMDGNGRWAKKRLMPRNMGHRQGAKQLKKIVEHCANLDIEVISVYAFSTENWTRPAEEVNYLLNLIGEFFKAWMPELIKEEIKVVFTGDLESLNDEVKTIVYDVLDKTKEHQRFTLNICLNYGGRNEIVSAIKKINEMGIKSEEITDELISKTLNYNNLPDIDLMVRTSGELRLSNFFLWELAYSEFYFADVHWPDFNKKELIKALEVYTSRDRRFGGLK
jgi:undecaprenyl diphosphate synthase